ncbi:MAG: hypothetical protein KAX39_06205 [candidate division Zixibacteria bacterium]|nr:hypothetical protein [candidate division Zixibacteria bacterium]
MHKHGYFGYRADAYAFIRIFTSYDNPKGNADTERVIRTIKEEIRMNASHNLAE